MFKKFGLTFYLDAVAAALAFIGCLFAIISNSIAEQAFAHSIVVILAAVVGLLATGAGTYLSMKLGDENDLVVAIKFVAMVAIGVAFAVIINDRAELASALFTWDTGNMAGWSAFRTSVIADVAFLISILSLIVCSFMKNKTQD